jgi:hypothetical protein
VSYFTLRWLSQKKMHVVERAGFTTVRLVTGDLVTTNPSPASASLPGLLSYLAVVGVGTWETNPRMLPACTQKPEAQAIFCRRRHQPRRPKLANIRPGRPAPAMGPGTADVGCGVKVPEKFVAQKTRRTQSVIRQCRLNVRFARKMG